ncbi:hypothetical protein PsorP6_003884 [Peronosclerospora sorghi]|uniref:Uncharacterized protein n=1 Tax=Peronosclerospora sorghi TaxID=230839 RepID=A0ACC0VRH4_9STRA|nr:hypothetical protein PsorP6_003884 [Peronosclerospora sorghi]
MVHQHWVDANKPKGDEKPCGNIFKNNLGLPCKRVIQSLLAAEKPLLTEHFNAHWLLRKDDGQPPAEPYPILPLLIHCTKGLPKAAHNKRNCRERLKGAPALPKNCKTAATSTPTPTQTVQTTPTLLFTADHLEAIASAVELSMHQQQPSTQMMS